MVFDSLSTENAEVRVVGPWHLPTQKHVRLAQDSWLETALALINQVKQEKAKEEEDQKRNGGRADEQVAG